ncbi:MAG: GNAT family N-acetyltransferase [Candidatus Scalindua sp.]
MKIQLAQVKHLRDVCKLLKVLDTEKRIFSNKKQTLFFISKQWCYIAVESGRVVGVMLLEPTEGSYKINTLVSRQKGTGKLLINWAIDICRKNNIPKLWCWSLARYAADGFYKKMGFTESFLLQKQWDGEDCYFLGKLINY